MRGQLFMHSSISRGTVNEKGETSEGAENGWINGHILSRTRRLLNVNARHRMPSDAGEMQVEPPEGEHEHKEEEVIIDLERGSCEPSQT